jgi:hypothetical protein
VKKYESGIYTFTGDENIQFRRERRTGSCKASTLRKTGASTILLTVKYRSALCKVSNSEYTKKTGEVNFMAEEKKKKGFLSAIKESMNKTGGCCGAGETCGAAPDTTEGKDKKKTPPK